MRIPVSRPVLLRILGGTAVLLVASACSSSSGCSGCTPQTIPGGFQTDKIMHNAMQVRLAQGGISFMENNFSTMITQFVPGGLSFTIPPSGCSSDTKICCKGSPCSASMSISKVTLTPTPQSTLKLAIDASLKTSKLNVEMKLWFITAACDIVYDSSKKSPSYVSLAGALDFSTTGTQKKLAITMGSSTLTNFDVADIDLSGGALCSITDFLKDLPGINTLIKNEVEKQLKSTLSTTLNSMLKTLPMGQEGRADLSSLMASFSPSTTGTMDYFIWAGGMPVQAENSGMSVPMMGGFRAAKHNPCVPDCEKSTSCTPPQLQALTYSNTFKGNTRPDGKAFDVGIGVHRSTLDHAAYALYSSGGLCLDVGTATVSQLSSSIFALLMPSLKTLTEGKNTPLTLSIRPRNPPTVELGKGTYTTGSNGKPVITDPLIKLKAKDMAIDVYLLADERMIRVFTIVTDLEVPVLLYADSAGKLQPLIGDLSKALKNVRVENNQLITESPTIITNLLPSLLSLAGSFTGDAIPPIDLPSLQGLKLIMDSGSITSTDAITGGGYNMLAIFTKLGLAKTTAGTPSPAPSMPEPSSGVDTLAQVESFVVPPTEGFRLALLDPRHQAGPTLVLRLDAVVPDGYAGRELEFAYRVNGGFFQGWTTARRLVLDDPQFLLQGRHTVEVMARIKDEPQTLDPEPVRIPLTVDTVAPTIQLHRTASGVTAAGADLVDSAADLRYSWSIDGSPFGPFEARPTLNLPEGAQVQVKVRDSAGNITLASLASGAPTSPDEPDLASGGCSASGQAGPLSLGLALGLILVLVRRRRRR